ncbi:MAG: ImmA/IrrE family metallo-endopeptidase [Clostridia bacterium]|nr:ImmA/IrrE family metallo-endopeptidase [Clostridia bacterium]
MDKEKLYKILEFNKSHSKEISTAKNIFYDSIGRQNPVVISDMQTLAQLIFDNKGYKFLRIPMKSKEIGAFQLRFNNSNYLVLNTSKSLANNNFAIAHELYHVLVQNNSTGNTADLYLNNYDEIEEEQMANAFAGAVIMPTEDVKSVVGLLEKKRVPIEEEQKHPYIHELITVFALMSYYQTTYMSVVIRCYELDIFDTGDSLLMNILLKNNSEEKQKELFRNMPMRKGDVSIMEPTGEDDFEKLFDEAKKIGEKNVARGLITLEDLEYRLEGLRNAYLYVREEA